MPLIPALPPQAVQIQSGFDYVSVDAQRRRVYAAHTGSRSLLVVDADSGKVLGQVRVGPLHGVAVDPSDGHVFTGDGEARTISEVDPVALKEVRTADVDGEIDAIAYDPATQRIYADEDDGTRIFVVDAKTMQSVGSVALPGHKPEYLAVDPKTHDVYQNISDLNEYVVVDPTKLAVRQTVPTPALVGNHPLQFDPGYRHVLVAGSNGVLAAYDVSGALVGTVAIPAHVDQCSLDPGTHEIACAAAGTLTLLRDNPTSAPTVVAQIVTGKSIHTLAIDPATHQIWAVWAEPGGDFVQAYKLAP
ncbi:MAG: YncE family protein [Vulcanimicrobiaceae bacterium]